MRDAQGLACPPTIDLFALTWGVEKSMGRFAKHYGVNSHDALIEQPPGLSGGTLIGPTTAQR